MSNGKITHNEFKIFSCISDFVEQLKEAICGEDNKNFHEVALYNHLIHKVKITNKQNIRRHISLFTEFCTRNQDSILNKNASLIVFNTIRYSEKIFINVSTILASGIDNDIKEAIWNHLIAISVAIDPSSKAKSLLINLATSKNPEEQMIGGLLGEISKHVDENDNRNPMAIFGSLMQSGVMNKMMASLDNSVKSGDIDMNKLGNTMQTMMSGLMKNMGGDEQKQAGGFDMNNLMGMIGGMLNSSNAPSSLSNASDDSSSSVALTSSDEKPQQPPIDLSNLMNNFSSMLGGNSAGASNGGGLDLGNMMSTMMGVMSTMNTPNSSGLSGTNPMDVQKQLEKQIEEEMKKEKQIEEGINKENS
jgi:hypothetical protein